MPLSILPLDRAARRPSGGNAYSSSLTKCGCISLATAFAASPVLPTGIAGAHQLAVQFLVLSLERSWYLETHSSPLLGEPRAASRLQQG
jgi:hypothetical protein